MPLGTLHLIAISPRKPLTSFVQELKASLSANEQPLTLAKVVRWVIVPEHIDADQLLQPSKPWDLLIILPSKITLPGPLEANIDAKFSLTVGIPSRIIRDFPQTNDELLHASSRPQLTGALDKPIVTKSAQDLSLSSELQSWINSFSKTSAGQRAVSMLNLLAFKPDHKESYLEYGKSFASSIGIKRGGVAKLVGHVIQPSSREGSPNVERSQGREGGYIHLTDDPTQTDGPVQNAGPTPKRKETSSVPSDQTQHGRKWDEFALAHYPSILHFADMLASEDYQTVNRQYRLPALRDTCILCTSEIDVEEMMRQAPEGDSVAPKVHAQAKL